MAALRVSLPLRVASSMALKTPGRCNRSSITTRRGSSDGPSAAVRARRKWKCSARVSLRCPSAGVGAASKYSRNAMGRPKLASTLRPLANMISSLRKRPACTLSENNRRNQLVSEPGSRPQKIDTGITCASNSGMPAAVSISVDRLDALRRSSSSTGMYSTPVRSMSGTWRPVRLGLGRPMSRQMRSSTNRSVQSRVASTYTTGRAGSRAISPTSGAGAAR